MSTTHQNEEQSNTPQYSFTYRFSPRKQRWLMEGESDCFTLNQICRLGDIAAALENELNEPYNSEVLAELRDIVARLYTLIGENSNG